MPPPSFGKTEMCESFKKSLGLTMVVLKVLLGSFLWLSSTDIFKLVTFAQGPTVAPHWSWNLIQTSSPIISHSVHLPNLIFIITNLILWLVKVTCFFSKSKSQNYRVLEKTISFTPFISDKGRLRLAESEGWLLRDFDLGLGHLTFHLVIFLADCCFLILIFTSEPLIRHGTAPNAICFPF